MGDEAEYLESLYINSSLDEEMEDREINEFISNFNKTGRRGKDGKLLLDSLSLDQMIWIASYAMKQERLLSVDMEQEVKLLDWNYRDSARHLARTQGQGMSKIKQRRIMMGYIRPFVVED